MRYIKVLLLACLIFLSLVFFFQNQGILATKMQLTLDLIFLPPMKSIVLPLYFIVVCAFFVGVLLAILLLVWDRLHLCSRLMKYKWQIQSLSSKLARAESLLNKTPRPGLFARIRKFFTTEEALPVAEASTQLPDTSSETQEQKNLDVVVEKCVDATVVASEKTNDIPQAMPLQQEAKQGA